MKIGILTFQPSLNYGGILQCLALKQTLERMGHSVAVFRRSTPWFDKTVAGPYPQWGWRSWLKFAIRSTFGMRDFEKWLRYSRTQRFCARLNILPWKFTSWTDAPANLDLDLLVVGSDMVWHSGDWGNPGPYLLEGAPDIPAIAYSASFGMSELPQRIDKGLFTGDDIPARYRAALSRFKAISCREAEGVGICEGLGLDAAHVVDPSQLPDFSLRRRNGGRLLVCYLMTYSAKELQAYIARIEDFARGFDCKVRVFIREGVSQNLPDAPLPLSPRKAKRWLVYLSRKVTSSVKVCIGAGPAEFLDAVGKARWMVTDSFHGLMFAIRSNCDIRILKPTNAERSTIFARIGEFADHFNGPLLADDMDTALASIARGEEVNCDYEWLNQWRTESLVWLKKAVKNVEVTK